MEIAEIFDSVQGEGKYTGHKVTFIRFLGCNLTCSFCDEPMHKMEGKQLSAFEIAAIVNAIPNRIVVMTGGEPTIQLLSDEGITLLRILGTLGKRIHVETNGEYVMSTELDSGYTQDLMKLVDFWTYSPKSVATYRGIESFLTYQQEDFDVVQCEIKIVVPTEEFETKEDLQPKKIIMGVHEYILQPKDVDSYMLESFKACVEIMPEEFTIRLQVHKIMGLK